MIIRKWMTNCITCLAQSCEVCIIQKGTKIPLDVRVCCIGSYYSIIQNNRDKQNQINSSNRLSNDTILYVILQS